MIVIITHRRVVALRLFLRNFFKLTTKLCFLLFLRFLANSSSWYGVATLMYTSVDSGPTGSRANVSDILRDPRNTLALLQYPSRPVVNVTGFTGVYSVGEDEDDRGFMVCCENLLNQGYF